MAWRSPPVLAVGFLALASGFGQFGAVAALGDVAKTFGHIGHGTSVAEEAGLSGTVIGLGLGVLRFASLGGLVLAALADTFGRRRTMLATCALGLMFTVIAAGAPSYWWFVGIFAMGRPLLSATLGVTQVAAAELTSMRERAKAISMVAAAYALGAGTTAVIYSLGKDTLGFRGTFALAVVPLAFLPLMARRVVEPARFVAVSSAQHRPPVLGPVGKEFRGRLLIVATVAFAVSVITGPANSFVFIYAQNVRHLSGIVTSIMIVAAGVVGLVGLLIGRALADGVGRRPTAAVAIVAMALSGILAYTGSSWALIVGYVCGVLSGALFAPAAGSLANELFPTAVRASVAGWNLAAGVVGAVVGLVVFGALADVGGHFGVAAALTFLPAVPFALLLWRVPETRGHEPEELWAG
jgi:MFS family permease